MSEIRGLITPLDTLPADRQAWRPEAFQTWLQMTAYT